MPTFSAGDYEYVELPEDTPLLCKIARVEEVPNRFAGQKNDDGKEAPATQLEVDLELVKGEFKGERIRTWVNPTFGPKSNLAKLACAALNVEWTKEMQLDTDELQGKQLYVIGDYGDDGKATRLKPRKYKPAAAGPGSGRRSTRPATTEKPAEQKREPVAAGATTTNGKADDDLDF